LVYSDNAVAARRETEEVYLPDAQEDPWWPWARAHPFGDQFYGKVIINYQAGRPVLVTVEKTHAPPRPPPENGGTGVAERIARRKQ